MPSGVVLTIPSAPPTASATSAPATARPAPNRSPSAAASSCGAGRIGVDDGEAVDAERQQRVRDRSAGAAGAELHHAAARHVRELAPEAFGKARPVGVVPDRAAVLEHDGVHGAERARIRGEGVEERDHRLLAGMGDVEPGKTEAPGGGQKLGKRVRRKAEGGDVDDLVDIAQALLGAFALVQARRARCLDAGADEAGKDRSARRRDSRRASCLVASPGAMRPGRRFQRLRNAHSGGASPGRRFLGGSSDPVNRVLTLFEKPRRPFASASRLHQLRARRLHLRRPERQRGFHPPRHGREHPQRRPSGEIAGDPGPQRLGHHGDRGRSTGAASRAASSGRASTRSTST